MYSGVATREISGFELAGLDRHYSCYALFAFHDRIRICTLTRSAHGRNDRLTILYVVFVEFAKKYFYSRGKKRNSLNRLKWLDTNDEYLATF